LDYNKIFSDTFPKYLKLTFTDENNNQVVLENANICAESMTLEESLCSEENLRFGACEASCFSIQISSNHSFKDNLLDAEMELRDVNGLSGKLWTENREFLVDDAGNNIVYANQNDKVIFPIGKYRVESDRPTNDRSYRNLICYDEMYYILNADVASWYDGLTFPLTVKQLRDSFFNYLNVTQENVTLINDTLSVQKGFLVEGTLSGKYIIESICEINGVFGHINRDGKFEYVSLPSNETIEYYWYIDGSGSYEQYTTEKITGIVAKSEDQDSGTVVGTSTNQYIIQGNPLVFGLEGTQDLTDALTRLLNKIKDITYRPFKVDTYGNPMLELGSNVILNTRDRVVSSFVMNRTMRGIQSLVDTISAVGEEVQPSPVNDFKNEISKLSGKSHILENTVDGLSSTVSEHTTDIGNLSTELTQTSDKIVLKVNTNGRIAQVKLGLDADDQSATDFKVKADNLNLSANDVFTIMSGGTLNLTSKNIAISSTDFSVTKAGAVTASSLTLTGGSINMGSGVFKVSNAGAVECSNLKVTGGSIKLGTKFEVSSTGALTSTSGTIAGWTINSGSISSSVTSGSITKEAIISSTNARITLKRNSSNKAVLDADGIEIDSAGACSFVLNGPSSGAVIGFDVTGSGMYARFSNLDVTGHKSRVVQTKDYGERHLYCYETPTPLFGDVGEGTIAEDGKCYVWLDAMFEQTIYNYGYQVFLQKYGDGDCYVSERTASYFVVEGDAGLSFGWEIKAKQDNYEMTRLGQIVEGGKQEFNYGAMAEEHINEIKSERSVA